MNGKSNDVSTMLAQAAKAVGLDVYRMHNLVSIFEIEEVVRDPESEVEFSGGVDTRVKVSLFALRIQDDDAIGESPEEPLTIAKKMTDISGMGIGTSMLEEESYIVEALVESYVRFFEESLTEEDMHECARAIEALPTEADYLQFADAYLGIDKQLELIND